MFILTHKLCQRKHKRVILYLKKTFFIESLLFLSPPDWEVSVSLQNTFLFLKKAPFKHMFVHTKCWFNLQGQQSTFLHSYHCVNVLISHEECLAQIRCSIHLQLIVCNFTVLVPVSLLSQRWSAAADSCYQRKVPTSSLSAQDNSRQTQSAAGCWTLRSIS